MKTIFHVTPKFFLWTKLPENLLPAEYFWSAAANLIYSNYLPSLHSLNASELKNKRQKQVSQFLYCGKKKVSVTVLFEWEIFLYVFSRATWRSGWGVKKFLGYQLLTKSLKLCIQILLDGLESKNTPQYDHLHGKL